MIVKFGLYIFCLLLLESCKVDNHIIDNDSCMVEVINIDVVGVLKNSDNEEDHFLLSEIADAFNIVPLEFTDESMISSIEDVQIFDDNIFVVDSKLSLVLRFDKEGSFINSIGKKGQGPGEYKYLYCMDINLKNNEVYLYTNMGMIIYDLNGSFLRKINNTRPSDIFNSLEPDFFIFNNSLFLTDHLPVQTKTDLWSLASVDSAFNINKKYYNPSFYGNEMDIINNGTKYDVLKNYWIDGRLRTDFYRNNFMMSYYGVDSIYQFVDSCANFISKYYLDMGDRPSFKVSHEWIKSDDFFSFLWLYDFCCVDDYVFLSVCKNQNKYIVKYNKVTGGVQYVQSKVSFREANFSGLLYKRVKNSRIEFFDDFCSNTNFVLEYKSNGYYISAVSSDVVKSGYNKCYKSASDIKDDSNPVLLIATLKK